ncbi:MAG: helix-turn-helix domain-containing protein, partial [Thermoplasmatota archaeon]
AGAARAWTWGPDGRSRTYEPTLHGGLRLAPQPGDAFLSYRPEHLVESEILAETRGRLVLWYKYRPTTSTGPSLTAAAFRLLGRDTVITDETVAGALTVRLLCRAGPGLAQFLRLVRDTPGAALVYSGPPRARLIPPFTAAEEKALEVAYRLGHFAVPSRAGIRAVARELGLPPSTASYRLRRAQAKLVSAHLG